MAARYMNMVLGHFFQKALSASEKDHIVLNYLDYRVKRNRINLHWAPNRRKSKLGFVLRDWSEAQNLGDYLANPIYDYMLSYYNLDRDIRRKKTIHLYTVGSIIQLGYQDAVIWGSGLLKTEPEGLVWNRSKYRNLDVRCVRGPETERRLIENGYAVPHGVYGDPGVLLPLIYTPTISIPKKQYGVILHMQKYHKVENGISIVTDNWQSTIDDICSCELIISSSLHGIIIAEAYGIPAILLDDTPHEGDRFKYNDYYYSTGRTTYSVCKSIDEALSMPKPEVPNLDKLRENLINSFPVDLWK